MGSKIFHFKVDSFSEGTLGVGTQTSEVTEVVPLVNWEEKTPRSVSISVNQTLGEVPLRIALYVSYDNIVIFHFA